MKELLVKGGKFRDTEKIGNLLNERSRSLASAQDIMKIGGVLSQDKSKLIKRYSFLFAPFGYNFSYAGSGIYSHLNGSIYKDRTKSYACQPFYSPMSYDKVIHDKNDSLSEMSDVRERLKALRKALGLSQSEFAQRLGVSKDLISKYEQGRRSIPDKTLRLISHTFGVSYEWLKTGKGEMWEKPFSDVQISIIKEIVRELKKIEQEYDIEIPPDLFAKAVETIYEEVVKEMKRGNQNREKLVKKGVGKIIKLVS